MNRLLFLSLAIFSFTAFGCADAKTETQQNTIDKQPATASIVNQPSDFIPDGYKLFEEISGDLNKDGLPDRVLIIKASNKDSIVEVAHRGKLDRNRRGIIILFKNKSGYTLALKNYNCFSSENEDGGVYTPPDLWFYIKKGNLYVHYGHGRYGYWRYVFRHQKPDFELIGYDSSSNSGGVVNSEKSINFLTKEMIEKVNTNNEAEGGDEVFEETRDDIYVEDPLLLSEVQNFDALDISECCYSVP